MNIEDHIDEYILDGQFIERFDDSLIKAMYIQSCQKSERFPCLLDDDIFFSWMPVAWESAQLKMTVKRLDYISHTVANEGQLKKILGRLTNADLIYMRLNGHHPLMSGMPSNHLGFTEYAQKYMLACGLDPDRPHFFQKHVRSFGQLDVVDKQAQLLKIAERSFTANRFFRDHRFPSQFYRTVYRGLIEQYFSRPEDVLCFSNGRDILGFLAFDVCTTPIRYGFVNLVAVADHARGRGVADILMNSLKDMLAHDELSILYANVDAENQASFHYFLKNGFRQFNRLIEYHWWR